MLLIFSKYICFLMLYFPDISVSNLLIRLSCIFFFISLAAALVKVTIKNSSIFIFFPIKVSIILSTNTAVFPEPAAAETRRFLSLFMIAVFCSSVQFIMFFTYLFKNIFKIFFIDFFYNFVFIIRHSFIKLTYIYIGAPFTRNVLVSLEGFY